MIVLLLLFSSSVTSTSLRPHGLQHSRFSCPLLSPEVCWNSCPLFFLPSFTSLIPLFIHFLRCFYFNILLKSVIGVGCLCLLSSVDDAESVHRGHRGKNSHNTLYISKTEDTTKLKDCFGNVIH